MPGDLPKPRLLRQPIHIAWLINSAPEPMEFSAGGLMHPQLVTTLYGAGGIGKGWVAAWAYRELVGEGYNPLILDFEGVRDEWWTRLRWMGFHEPIAYHEATSRLTIKYASEIAEAIQAYDFTHIILDSASTARGRPADNDAGGSDATVDMFKGMKSWGVPVLLIAHEPKHGEGPIGSIHFQSQSRLMWRAKAVPNGTELRMTKANDVPMSDKPLTFFRVPMPGGGIDIVKDWPLEKVQPIPTVSGSIVQSMRHGRSMTAEEVQIKLNREGHEVSLTKVASIMRKMHMEGKLVRVSRGRYALPPVVEDEPVN